MRIVRAAMIVVALYLLGVGAHSTHFPWVDIRPAEAQVHAIYCDTVSEISGTCTVEIASNVATSVQVDDSRKKLTGQERTNGFEIAKQMATDMQFNVDFRQPLNELPDDDPDKTIDPARCDLFWQVLDGTTYLTGRSILVNVEWDRSLYRLGVRRACP